MRYLSLLVAIALLPNPAQAATVVSTCGQIVAAGGELAADLDCSGFPTAAVVLEAGMFDLKGFTLTGGDADAIQCVGSCEIFSTGGIGSVQGAAGAAINGGTGLLTVSNLDIQGNGGGIYGGGFGTDGADVAVHDNGGGIYCGDISLRVQDSVVANNLGSGIGAGECRANIINVDVTGNGGTGIYGRNIDVSDSDISGNGLDGIRQIANVPCGPAPGDGLCPKRTRVSNCTINDNGGTGIEVISGIDLRDSTVSGNGEGGVSDVGQWVSYHPDKPQKYPCGSASVLGSHIDGNTGTGFSSGSRTIKVRESEASNNSGEGFTVSSPYSCTRQLRVTDSIANGNGLHGIDGSAVDNPDARLGVKGTTASGNGTDPSCGVSQTCADVAHGSLPRVSTTTCASSYDSNSGFPGTSWGVCSSD